ncbi:hypothetical protein AB840_10210 [Megasphaera cerevisiae DSM 20462]|jgi:hypothetical protein|uniref:DUF4911 domain-containing protein n=1 Tax=Megasphaera cerevisiae DSM 20462 TaxID=1122219 RepID=A0A0J6WU45_9FIRM|nr:DUF4911 domain-containing protein [Megasphaera cerevisiae]KMO86044.1 hypothetical protein AB840_10210 [Megasphaera cerevisiae DSM 20462]OKY52469.1 DUF4911 domain-containing protein [Megasphaera cerevisiae]SKA04078.1 protein of unknown function [Megasphaera cerevisiae DSM 20462]
MLDADWVYFRIPPEKMTFVTRILEGAEYVGAVTALDGKKGIGFVRSTPDTAAAARELLLSLPFETEILTYDDALRYE